MSRKVSVVGDLINFRGLVYAPINENGVVFLFGKVTEDLHMYVEEIKPGFPDCIARRFTGKGWERIRIEFEYKSSNFKLHKHDAKQCDLIVRWEHDWKDCPLEVIELHTEIQDLENQPIKRPGKSKDDEDFEPTMSALFDRIETQPRAVQWWNQIHTELSKVDDSIWLNVGAKQVGLYSPEKSFASFQPKKTTLVFECFTRGEVMKGVKVANKKYSPRWGRFSIKAAADVKPAVRYLLEARKRLRAAIKAGERTSYYSGGQAFGANPTTSADVDEE